jgi:hypothetical protein
MGEDAVSTQTLQLFMVVVALLAAVALFYYYVRGVLDKDRVLSRGSLLGFLVFGAVSRVMLLRLLA